MQYMYSKFNPTLIAYHQIYYNNIRMLGLEYDFLDYKNALPFLLMLPNALIELQNE